MKTYTREEVYAATLEYFKGDELASETFFKYALKDREGIFYEKSPEDMHRRLAKEFARMESKFGSDRAMSEEYIFGLFNRFEYVSPQGSPMMGIGNNFQNVSLSNCIVVASPEDDMSSIMNSARDMANLFKRRCGVGINISNLRPEGTAVSNSAGTSTGAWSFADFYSYVTRMVGQSGRRAALMISLDVRHPDIEKFAVMKRDLTKVTGANVSIMLTDDFMRAVKNDTEFELRWPVDYIEEPKIRKTVNARDVWDIIVESATGYAEPGLLMWDTMLKYLPAERYSQFHTIGVNPCAELGLSAFDSCRLISQNLKWYVNNPFTPEAEFDFDLLEEHTSAAQRLSDDLVELELEKLKKLIDISGSGDEKILYERLYKSCHDGRRTGLGTHGLADAIARMCLAYDSDESIELIEKIYELRKNAAYTESVELAAERGPFPVWDTKLEKDHPFLMSLSPMIQKNMANFGRRNISLLTNAPTGSVSIVSQTSSGIEPVFKNSYTRRKKKNHDEAPADTDFVDDMGDRWREFEVSHHNINQWKEIVKGDQNPLPDYFVESDNIDWEQRIKVQAAIQRHVDHSISSTINLPKGTSKEVVGSLYMKAWEHELKGLTVYVDGSRSGVLVSKEDAKVEFNHVSAPKRPTEMECDIQHMKVKGESWVFFVGLMNDKPYEVFGGLADNIEIPSEHKKGIIIKTSDFKNTANRYDLKIDGFVIKNFLKQFNNPTNQVLTRMVSLSLRHGANPEFLMSQLSKDPDNSLTSFSKVLSRVLKRYVLDGTKVESDKVCEQCGADSLVYQEGCISCSSCSWSRC